MDITWDSHNNHRAIILFYENTNIKQVFRVVSVALHNEEWHLTNLKK